jgi:hypothetical protein
MNVNQRHFRNCFSKALQENSCFSVFRSKRNYDGFLQLLEEHEIDHPLEIAAAASAHFILHGPGLLDQIALGAIIAYLESSIEVPAHHDRNAFIAAMLSSIPAAPEEYLQILREHYEPH